MKKAAITLALLAAVSMGATGAMGETLNEVVEQIAKHMLHDQPLRPPRNSLAVMQFTPVRGSVQDLGDYLMQKVRIRMFDLDKGKKVRFVSQGKVTSILVNQGLKNMNVVYDEKQRVELGNLLTAHYMVYGTYEAFRDRSAEIVAYLVDVKTGITLAQTVQTARDIPTRLISGGSSRGASAPYPYSAKAKSLVSKPDSAKRYRMAGIFKKRNNPKRARALLEGILKSHPNTLEAKYALLEIMSEDLAKLSGQKRFDDSFFNAVTGLPKNHKSGTRYARLHNGTLTWLELLGTAALQSARGLPEAKSHYARARQLDKSGAATAGFKEKIKLQDKEFADLRRADRIRAIFRDGRKDDAELMLVEWEAEEPDSPHLELLRNELSRSKGMVTIPTGKLHGAVVKSFNIDRCEVTNTQFLEFVKAKPAFRRGNMTKELNDKDYLERWAGNLKFGPSYKKIPVVFVSQLVAKAYCEWKGLRLPTNQEWGRAAGEGTRKFPWGNEKADKQRANYDKDLLGDPLPCESHPRGKSPEGVYHLAGNVWDLTSSVDKSGKAISRGGSYYDHAKILRNTNRLLSSDPQTYSSRFTGFRCAK